MALLYGNICILIFIATNGIAILDDFNNINDIFSYRNVLVSPLTNLLYNDYKKYCDFVARFMASWLVNSSNNATIIFSLAEKLFEEIELNTYSKDRFLIILSIIQKIVLRLRLNKSDYNIINLLITLIVTSNSSLRKYYIMAKEI